MNKKKVIQELKSIEVNLQLKGDIDKCHTALMKLWKDEVNQLYKSMSPDLLEKLQGVERLEKLANISYENRGHYKMFVGSSISSTLQKMEIPYNHKKRMAHFEKWREKDQPRTN